MPEEPDPSMSDSEAEMAEDSDTPAGSDATDTTDSGSEDMPEEPNPSMSDSEAEMAEDSDSPAGSDATDATNSSRGENDWDNPAILEKDISQRGDHEYEDLRSCEDHTKKHLVDNSVLERHGSDEIDFHSWYSGDKIYDNATPDDQTDAAGYSVEEDSDETSINNDVNERARKELDELSRQQEEQQYWEEVEEEEQKRIDEEALEQEETAEEQKRLTDEANEEQKKKDEEILSQKQAELQELDRKSLEEMNEQYNAYNQQYAQYKKDIEMSRNEEERAFWVRRANEIWELRDKLGGEIEMYKNKQ